MALCALNLDALRQYVSPRDPGWSEWKQGAINGVTVFSLRTLSSRELMDVLDSTQEIVTRADATRGLRVDINRRNFRLVASSLAGWHNFKDDRGNPVAFELENTSERRPG